jgi:nitrous oxidase accessory protein NosD
MHLLVVLFCACSLAIAENTFSSEATSPSQASGDGQTLWNLERAYWRYVEQNDLAAYSDLWHKDFFRLAVG